MNKKALSPVAASIILIAVVVAVGISVAAIMGVLTFSFTPKEFEKEPLKLELTIPKRHDATHATYWLHFEPTALWYSPTLNSTNIITKLPFNVTCEIEDEYRDKKVWLDVTYYRQTSSNLYRKICTETSLVSLEATQ